MNSRLEFDYSKIRKRRSDNRIYMTKFTFIEREFISHFIEQLIVLRSF